MIGHRLGKNEISFELELYQERSPVVRVDSDTLRRNCIAKDKWSLDNPGQAALYYVLKKGAAQCSYYIDRAVGIILSMCLTVALRISFTPSVSPRAVRASAVAGMPSTSMELFNVYGPMRMVPHSNFSRTSESRYNKTFSYSSQYDQVMEDIDDWYTKAKQLVAQDVLAKGSLPVTNSLTSREVVSFHYVNQMEAGLLYRLLARRERGGGEGEEGGRGRLTVGEVRRLWPSTNAEAGPYSRRLQSESEAQKLLLLLEAIEIT